MGYLKKILTLILLVASLGVSSSFAAGVGNTTTDSVNGSDSTTVDAITNDGDAIIKSMVGRSDYDVVQDVENTFKSIRKGIDEYTGTIRDRMLGYGSTMLGGLAIIAVGLLGINLALEGGNMGSIMADLIQTAIKIGIAVLFLNEYMTWFDDYLLKSFMFLAHEAMPNFNEAQPEKLFTAIPVNFIVLVTAALSNLMDQGWFDIFSKLLPTLVLVLVLGIIMVVCGLLSVVAALSAYVMMGLGLAVGPIFIPWMVLQRTSFVFEGWLKFMITAGLTFFVIALLTGISNGALHALMQQFTGTQAHLGMAAMVTVNGFLPALLAGCTLAILTASLMMKASDIASSLISGGSEGIGHIGRSLVGKSGKVGDGALKSTGSGAARGLGKVMGTEGGPNLASTRGGFGRGKG